MEPTVDDGIEPVEPTAWRGRCGGLAPNRTIRRGVEPRLSWSRGAAAAAVGAAGPITFSAMELIEVPPGLAGVAVTATTVGDVLGDEGIYHYRGRSATALATSGSFEQAAAIVRDSSGEPA